MRIGILSDTHTGRPLDEFGPGPGEFLASVDLIVHTGDVTGPLVLDWMEQFGPLIVNRGNHDTFDDPRLEDVIVIEREGWRMGMAHIVLDHRHRGEERVEHLKRRGYGDSDLQIVIAGDTHYERLEYEIDTLIVNSGSLTLPHNQTVRLGSVVLLEVTRDGVQLYANESPIVTHYQPWRAIYQYGIVAFSLADDNGSMWRLEDYEDEDL